MTRPDLTDGEFNLAKSVYKSSIDYKKVKIHDEEFAFFQPANSGMVPNGEIYMSGTAYSADYSKESNGTKAFFIHEMAHVWQFQNKVLCPIASAIGLFIAYKGDYGASYKYTPDASKDLLDYNMEQQGEIIKDYFLKSIAGGKSSASPIGGSPHSKLLAILKKFIQNPSYPKLMAQKRTQESLKALENKYYCFPGDTEVLLPTGPKPIATIRPGDRVLARATDQSRVRAATVESVDRHRGRFSLHRAETSRESFMATSGHLVADLTSGGWTAVERLGDDTSLATDVGQRRLVHVDRCNATCETVYNLRLTESHNYFVTRSGVMVRDW